MKITIFGLLVCILLSCNQEPTNKNNHLLKKEEQILNTIVIKDNPSDIKDNLHVPNNDTKNL